VVKYSIFYIEKKLFRQLLQMYRCTVRLSKNLSCLFITLRLVILQKLWVLYLNYLKFIQGQSRDQINFFPVSLDKPADLDNEVRIIDLFVESLSIKDYGFRTDFTENGRPEYHPNDLLKLFIYGYLNKVLSSRDLEKECRQNIEVMWLLKCLKPDPNTISNFGRDNPKAIKRVFSTIVQIARHFDLIGGNLIACDSTIFRAQNSKKINYNQAKIARHVAYR
jgi:transposase